MPTRYRPNAVIPTVASGLNPGTPGRYAPSVLGGRCVPSANGDR
jgi:hypothetical protein